MISHRILLPLLLSFAVANAFAQDPKWADHQLVRYIVTGHFNPSVVLNLDNNGDILLAMRDGITLEELQNSGPTFNDSQIFLLAVSDLLAKVDGKYHPRLRFLSKEQTGVLRQASKKAAAAILADTRASWQKLAQAIKQSGRQAQAYAIMHAYVLDGLSWLLFEQDKLVPPRRLGKKHAWAGEMWALTPKRAGAGGGTRYRSGDYALSAYWDPDTYERIGKITAQGKSLRAMFEAIKAKGAVADAQLLQLGMSWGLLNKDGKLAVAVIEQKTGDPVYDAAVEATEALAKSVIARLDLDALKKGLASETNESALVIAYHEVMWDLADALVSEGLFKRPQVADKDAMLAPVLFVLHDSE